MAKTKHDFHMLNKRELLHLMDAGINDLVRFKRIAINQSITRETNRKRGWGLEPCWQCRAIAVKLGVPV